MFGKWESEFERQRERHEGLGHDLGEERAQGTGIDGLLRGDLHSCSVCI